MWPSWVYTDLVWGSNLEVSQTFSKHFQQKSSFWVVLLLLLWYCLMDIASEFPSAWGYWCFARGTAGLHCPSFFTQIGFMWKQYPLTQEHSLVNIKINRHDGQYAQFLERSFPRDPGAAKATLNSWPGPSAENCRGFLLYKIWRILSGIFLEDFSGHLFPTEMRRENPATKSAKNFGGSKKDPWRIRSAKNRPSTFWRNFSGKQFRNSFAALTCSPRSWQLLGHHLEQH